MLSPLRYPGSKSNFLETVAYILDFAAVPTCHIVEPYAGSAAVSIGLVEAGRMSRATLIERDPLLYAFWHCVFERTDDLIAQFLDTPITMASWEKSHARLRCDIPSDQNIVDLGLAGLLLNRMNFSGILHGGPIGGRSQKSQYKVDCRTNKDDIVCRILTIASLHQHFDVKFGDAIEYIGKGKNASGKFFYIDPPYFIKGESLYRFFYRHGDHKRLAGALRNVKTKWLLSYDSHHVVEFFYEDAVVRRVNFQYSARSPRKGEELLIANFELPHKYSRVVKRYVAPAF